MKPEDKKLFDTQMKVINRAKALGVFPSRWCVDQCTFAIDISKAKCGSKRLNLENLATFEDEDFLHDAIGICENIVRGGPEIGTIQNLFSPRCGWVE